MEKIGFSLIDKAGSEIKTFDGDFPPNLIVLPNGDQVLAAKANEQLGDWRLVERWLNDNPPSKWHRSISQGVSFDNSKIVVTINYEGEPSIVPDAITPRQARLALLNAGLLDQIEQAMKSMDKATNITWEFANEIDRSDPLLEAIGKQFRLSDLEIDNIFRLASEL